MMIGGVDRADDGPAMVEDLRDGDLGDRRLIGVQGLDLHLEPG
jgi:hypothetical protein